MNAHSFGWACLHASWIPQFCLMFHRAFVAVLLSAWAGAQSILSSVTLKSPRTISGRLIRFPLLVVSTSSQNGACTALFAGAYMFSIDVLHASNHFILISRAWPGYSSCLVISFGSRTVLLIMKATPVQPVGSSGSSDVIISRFLLKHSQILSVFSWSRWVSWRARIAILFLYMVWLT